MSKLYIIALLCLLIMIPNHGQTLEPTLTPLPDTHPLYPYTIEGLRSREYPASEINIRWVQGEAATFTTYYINYLSDDLTITGAMNVPIGEGPFPVIVMLHGYYDREGFWSGMGTWQSAEYFARNGFITIAPDFRSWGQSDVGANLFATGLTIDTLNLISAIPSLPQADTDNIFVWGHSMGGGVATKTIVVDNERIKAAILYAPNSANDADLIERWGAACLPGQSELAGDKCNPAEVLPPNADVALFDAYFYAAIDPDAMQQIAPIYHLDYVNVPVQIHIGTADGALLAQTPPEWSSNLYDALLDAEKDVTYYTYEGQGHFLAGESWLLMMERSLMLFNTLIE